MFFWWKHFIVKVFRAHWSFDRRLLMWAQASLLRLPSPKLRWWICPFSEMNRVSTFHSILLLRRIDFSDLAANIASNIIDEAFEGIGSTLSMLKSKTWRLLLNWKKGSRASKTRSKVMISSTCSYTDWIKIFRPCMDLLCDRPPKNAFQSDGSIAPMTRRYKNFMCWLAPILFPAASQSTSIRSSESLQYSWR